jgi:predicted amidohydrolase
MRVTVLELPATWGDPAAALARVDALLAGGAPTDLVLLPEQSLTGYVSPQGDFDAARFAEPLDGPTATALAALARRRAVHLVAPLVLAEQGAIYNAALSFAPDGALGFVYRKRHPWLPEHWASPGIAAPPVVRIRGLAVTICICYDVHFVAAESARLLGNADLLLFPSAWVDEHATRIPLLTRLARRFGVAVANANWGPGVVRLRGQGDSIVIDARGETLARVVDAGSRADATVEPRARE